MPKATGQCLCGGVKFNAQHIDLHTYACHCKMCQRWSGGLWISVNATGVQFHGQTNLKIYPSSEWAERGFCLICGSNLFYRYTETDTFVFGLGVFDDTTNFILSEEIFIDQKPRAYSLKGDHAKLTEAELLAKNNNR